MMISPLRTRAFFLVIFCKNANKVIVDWTYLPHTTVILDQYLNYKIMHIIN